MGCGCNKSRVANVTSSARRVTAYQVLNGSTVVAEFPTLQEARAKAVEVGGRVKVTTVTVTN